MNPISKPQAAFTLLELLVVLGILGAMLSLVSVNISIDSNEEELKREAQQLSFELQNIAEKAWLSGSTSVITISNGKWGRWIPIETRTSELKESDEEDSVSKKWIEKDDFYESNADVAYDIDVELKTLKKALSTLSFPKNAQFVFLASGEYLPFSILIRSGEHSLTIEGDGINAIEVH